jgi:hypothetical protein
MDQVAGYFVITVSNSSTAGSGSRGIDGAGAATGC